VAIFIMSRGLPTWLHFIKSGGAFKNKRLQMQQKQLIFKLFPSMFFHQVMLFQYIFTILISFFPPNSMDMIGPVSWSSVVVKFDDESWSV
jgi:hypothetical protein